MKKTEEYIICAANYYNTGEEHPHQPSNIKKGFVICGHRHHNCITTLYIFNKHLPRDKYNALRKTEEQGFLTSHNRFVSRETAAGIALLNKQCTTLISPHIGLHSEDIY